MLIQMNKIYIKSISLVLLLFISSEKVALSQVNLEIIYKINNEIITNIDVENEKKFLIFLNPQLSNLSNSKLLEISKNSIKNRTIKKIELENYFNLNEKDLGKIYINNFISNSNFKNIENLNSELSSFDLGYKYFENNFKIDNLWREFIFNKFKSKVKINIEDLKKDLKNKKNEIEELNLSEILFVAKNEDEYNKLKNKIYSEIEKSGFEATATIFSISESKNFGGKLGWVRSSQISGPIYSILKNISGVSEPLKTSNGYLIIKLNDKRKISEKINVDEELNKIINSETEKEINKLGYIYFNKIKKRIFISEK